MSHPPLYDAGRKMNAEISCSSRLKRFFRKSAESVATTVTASHLRVRCVTDRRKYPLARDVLFGNGIQNPTRQEATEKRKDVRG